MHQQLAVLVVVKACGMSTCCSPDALFSHIIPAGGQLSPEGVVLILDLLVVLDALVDVVLASEGRHLLLQLTLPFLHCLQLHPLLLGYCLCLPQLLLHCLQHGRHLRQSACL